MKRFLRYWLPPMIWAVFMFPSLNTVLSKSWFWGVVIRFFQWLFPGASDDTLGLLYILVRKCIHFIEYAILAWLLFRAFRAERRKRWDRKWAFPAAAISVCYGLFDEFVQTFIPTRSGNLLDSGIDAAGAVFALGLIFRKSRRVNGGLACVRVSDRLGAFNFLKRPFDAALSFLGILLSSPLWLLFSLIIWIQDRGPVFYSQDRVGKGGRIFKAVKFRSMIRDAEKGRGPVQAVEHDPRVTRIGRILRSTAMDELPQLWNIFKGDMSFVGPRALRPEEKEVHGDPDTRRIDEIPGYKERLAVRPGLTGLAQVFLPSDAPRRKKFRYDRLYIRRRTFWLDLETIFLSFWITFRGKWESRQNKI